MKISRKTLISACQQELIRRYLLSLHMDWEVPFQTFKNKKKRYAYLVFGNLRNFQIVYEKRHSGSHAMAWATVSISCVQRFSQDPHSRTWHSKRHASCIITKGLSRRWERRGRQYGKETRNGHLLFARSGNH